MSNISTKATGAITGAALLLSGCMSTTTGPTSSEPSIVEPPRLTASDKRNLAAAFGDNPSITRGRDCSVSIDAFNIHHTNEAVSAIGGQAITIDAEVLAQNGEHYSSTVSSMGVLSHTAGDAISLKGWRKGDQGPEGWAVDTPDNAYSVTLEFADGNNPGDAVLVNIGEGFSSYKLGPADERGVRDVTIASNGNDFINGVTVIANEFSGGLVGAYGEVAVIACETEGGFLGSTPDLPTPEPVTPAEGGCISGCPSTGSNNDRGENNRDRSTGQETTGGNDPAGGGGRNEGRGSTGTDRGQGGNTGNDNGNTGNDPSSSGRSRTSFLIQEFNDSPFAQEHNLFAANDGQLYTYAAPEVA